MKVKGLKKIYFLYMSIFYLFIYMILFWSYYPNVADISVFMGAIGFILFGSYLYII